METKSFMKIWLISIKLRKIQLYKLVGWYWHCNAESRLMETYEMWYKNSTQRVSLSKHVRCGTITTTPIGLMRHVRWGTNTSTQIGLMRHVRWCTNTSTPIGLMRHVRWGTNTSTPIGLMRHVRWGTNTSTPIGLMRHVRWGADPYVCHGLNTLNWDNLNKTGLGRGGLYKLNYMNLILTLVCLNEKTMLFLPITVLIYINSKLVLIR